MQNIQVQMPMQAMQSRMAQPNQAPQNMPQTRIHQAPVQNQQGIAHATNTAPVMAAYTSPPQPVQAQVLNHQHVPSNPQPMSSVITEGTNSNDEQDEDSPFPFYVGTMYHVKTDEETEEIDDDTAENNEEASLGMGSEGQDNYSCSYSKYILGRIIGQEI